MVWWNWQIVSKSIKIWDISLIETTHLFGNLQFERLQKEADAIRVKLDAAVAAKASISSTLNKTDQLELDATLQGLLDGFTRITSAIEERNKSLHSIVQQQREIATKVNSIKPSHAHWNQLKLIRSIWIDFQVDESMAFLNKIQEDMHGLNKPIGCKPEDTQTMLNSYESLLAELRLYRQNLEDLQHRTAGNWSHFVWFKSTGFLKF